MVRSLAAISSAKVGEDFQRRLLCGDDLMRLFEEIGEEGFLEGTLRVDSSILVGLAVEEEGGLL